jgi:putative peptide zinc metalloprotease protein
VPLFDPSVLLNGLSSLGSKLFSRAGFVAWMAIVATALLMLMPHWTELMSYGTRLLKLRYVVLMALCYPFVKALHELGHALAVRVWGGEVREMGVALMMLIPVPYVDASAASGFKARHRRVIVGAAGIMVELLLAAIAGLLWLNVEDGEVRDVAFVVMAIGGISTVLFNGNPLMRLDGYFVLCDALEIPNLGTRANSAFFGFVQRYVLNIKTVTMPRTDTFERWFLPSYAMVSAVYRLLISGVILLWISATSVALATLAAGWMLLTIILMPTYRGMTFLLRSSALAKHRVRAIGTCVAMVLGLVVCLFFMPFPAASRSLGVVWFPEHAQIRAQASGFATEVLGQDGAEVALGAPLIVLSNPALETKLKTSEARVRTLLVRERQAMRDNPADLQAAVHERATVEAELAEVQRQVSQLHIDAGVAGHLVLPHGEDLPGSYVKQGTTLGHVVTQDSMIIRVAVPQAQAGRIRERVEAVQIKLAEHPDLTYAAHVLREVPAGDKQLPSAAVGDRAGGTIRTDPADQDGLKTLEPVFFFDLGVHGLKHDRVGGRVHVRFDHGTEPIGQQLARKLRQLFLKHANT